MRFRQFGFAILAAMLLPLAAMPALAQGKVEAPDGDWQHKGTGTSFPVSAASFHRISIHEFSEDGRDAGVSYQLQAAESTLTVTVYVYPASGDSCEDEFRGVVAGISKYEGSTITRAGPISVPWIGALSSGYHARLALPAGAMRADVPAALSDGFLYCPADTDWRVKYRATWFGAEETFPDVGPLLNALGWPEPLR